MKNVSMIVIVSLLLAVSGCKKAEELARYKEQAVALAGKYGPQLGEVAKKLPELLSRAKSLPVNIPGVDKVTKLLEDNKGSVETLQGLLSSLPGQVASGKAEDAKKALDGADETLKSGLSAVTANLETAEADLAKLEQAKAAPAAPATAGGTSIKLDTGVELVGNADGVETQLVEFLKDKSKPVDKTTWFNFDRLSFVEGKSELDPGKSNEQLANVVAILKAFPSAKLKIGGYTDNTGSAESNKKISGARAEAVVTALVGAGVAKDRLKGEGYGPDFAVCPANDTDECKAKNRRIAVRVTAK
jgi:outer membrane protein OmpA-like peptidoglycan-associated protein